MKKVFKGWAFASDLKRVLHKDNEMFGGRWSVFSVMWKSKKEAMIHTPYFVEPVRVSIVIELED